CATLVQILVVVRKGNTTTLYGGLRIASLLLKGVDIDATNANRSRCNTIRPNPLNSNPIQSLSISPT
ncbi:hypothetical protein, partial [Salmonella enterica]|uniref:hypothetical protein n=1 Tax=Salmonella enterica TaxID=28901 RepID=UPI0020C4E57E